MVLLSVNSHGIIEGMLALLTLFVMVGIAGLIALIYAIRGIRLFKRSNAHPNTAQATKILAWNLTEPSITMIAIMVMAYLTNNRSQVPDIDPFQPWFVYVVVSVVFNSLPFFLPIIITTQILPRRNRDAMNPKAHLARSLSAKTGLKRLICYGMVPFIQVAALYLDLPFVMLYPLCVAIAIVMLVIIRRSLFQVYDEQFAAYKQSLAIVGGKQGIEVARSDNGSAMKVLIEPSQPDNTV